MSKPPAPTISQAEKDDPLSHKALELTADTFYDLWEALKTLYIRGNQGGRIHFTKEWPQVAAYIFGAELMDFDAHGTDNLERRSALENEAEEKQFSLLGLFDELEENSVLNGSLQAEYAEKVVKVLGRDLALLVYQDKIVNRFIPPSAEEREAAKEQKAGKTKDPKNKGLAQGEEIVATPISTDPPPSVPSTPAPEPIEEQSDLIGESLHESTEEVQEAAKAVIDDNMPESMPAPIQAPTPQEPTLQAQPESTQAPPVAPPSPAMEDESTLSPIETPPPPSAPQAEAEPIEEQIKPASLPSDMTVDLSDDEDDASLSASTPDAPNVNPEPPSAHHTEPEKKIALPSDMMVDLSDDGEEDGAHGSPEPSPSPSPSTSPPSPPSETQPTPPAPVPLVEPIQHEVGETVGTNQEDVLKAEMQDVPDVPRPETPASFSMEENESPGARPPVSVSGKIIVPGSETEANMNATLPDEVDVAPVASEQQASPAAQQVTPVPETSPAASPAKHGPITPPIPPSSILKPQNATQKTDEQNQLPSGTNAPDADDEKSE